MMSGKSNYLIKRVEFVTKVYMHYREAIIVIMAFIILCLSFVLSGEFMYGIWLERISHFPIWEVVYFKIDNSDIYIDVDFAYYLHHMDMINSIINVYRVNNGLCK